MPVLSYGTSDFSDEKSQFSVRVDDPGDGLIATLETQANAFRDLVTACALSAFVTRSVLTQQNEYPAKSADPYAQRETKARVEMTDLANNRENTFEIPCPDLTKLDTQGKFFDLTDADIAALVTWIENNVVSRDGNAVVVDRIRHVGRNI